MEGSTSQGKDILEKVAQRISPKFSKISQRPKWTLKICNEEEVDYYRQRKHEKIEMAANVSC